MAEALTDIDVLLLGRWNDAIGIREAIGELEDRLGDQLEHLADRLQPWLKDRGYVLFDVERRYAAVNVGKANWRKKDDHLIYISIAALYPYGYRKVDEEHPYVWLYADGLSESEQELFRDEVSARLKSRSGDWLNDDCGDNAPAGRYIRSCSDGDRAQLAQSRQSLERFVKEELEPILALGGEFDAALQVARK